MFNETDKTYIRTLHINNNQPDTLAHQLRLARTFSALDLQPPGLPASAILCIRKIRAPRQPAQPTHIWEQNVSASLKYLHEHAERPAQKEPAPDAQAILFSDRAEMLASLAHDWYTGKLTQHWWWQSLFPDQSHANLPIQTWLTNTAYVPAALHHLATRGEATSFIRLLPSPIVHTLLEGIIHHFALHALQPVCFPAHLPLEKTSSPTITGRGRGLSRPVSDLSRKETSSPFITNISLPISDHPQPGTPSPFSAQPVPPLSQSNLAPTSAAPWQQWVPECQNLQEHTIHQLFTAVALMLIRAPGLVRTPTFAHATYQWQQNTPPPQSASAEQPSHSSHTSKPDTTQESTIHSQSSSSPLAPQHQTDTKPAPLPNHNPENQATSMHTTQTQNQKEAIRNLNPANNDLRNFPPTNAESTITTANSLLTTKISSSPEETRKDEISQYQAIRSTTGDSSAIEISRQELIDPLLPSSAAHTLPSSQYSPLESNSEHSLSSQLQNSDYPSSQQSASLNSLHTTSTIYHEASSTPTLSFIPILPPIIEGTYETCFGGLFYFVNVALYLELYGDFSAPAYPGLPLTIWDFLALLGHRLTNGGIQDDPLWELLALLSGREKHDPPGTCFEPLTDWRIPPHWLKSFPDENNWLWQKSSERVQLYHPTGFLVLDLPIIGDKNDCIHKQLTLELLAYQDQQEIALSPLENLTSPTTYTSNPTGISPQIVRWLDCLTPYLYRRLQRALGTINDPIPTLCIQQAHITLTATHLDISLSLATLPIEVRMAGLDRNPGWVPAAGRYITFYFL